MLRTGSQHPPMSAPWKMLPNLKLKQTAPKSCRVSVFHPICSPQSYRKCKPKPCADRNGVENSLVEMDSRIVVNKLPPPPLKGLVKGACFPIRAQFTNAWRHLQLLCTRVANALARVAEIFGIGKTAICKTAICGFLHDLHLMQVWWFGRWTGA